MIRTKLLVCAIVLCIPMQGHASTQVQTFSYTIAPNDTLYAIANRQRIPLSALLAVNTTLPNPDMLLPGQTITVPIGPREYAYGVFPLPANTSTYRNDFGEVRSFGTSTTHEGIDLYAPEQTPIRAAATGTVFSIGWNTSGGWRISVRTSQNTIMYYAHLSRYERTFVLGETVRAGQRIGYVGSSGYGPIGTTGKFVPHLHFGMYTIAPWQAQNPYTYLVWWQLSLYR